MFGNLVEFLFDVGGEAVVYDVIEVLGKKIRNELADGGGEEFTFGGTRFFLDDGASDGGGVRSGLGGSGGRV